MPSEPRKAKPSQFAAFIHAGGPSRHQVFDIDRAVLQKFEALADPSRSPGGFLATAQAFSTPGAGPGCALPGGPSAFTVVVITTQHTPGAVAIRFSATAN